MLRGRWLNKRANEKSFEVHFWSVALTFAIINSTIDNSKSGGVVMSSIDLVILGIVLEKPQSAMTFKGCGVPPSFSAGQK